MLRCHVLLPWQDSSLVKQRLELVRLALDQPRSLTALARRFGVSRKTAHKWVVRHAQFGATGLADRSCVPLRQPDRLSDSLRERLLALRRAHPTWGAKKLRSLLLAELAPGSPPAVRTLTRWLARAGLSRRRLRRARPGPRLPWPGLLNPQAPNDVWTVDFKGAFRTGDGQRCEPLTVRDLFSRTVLLIEILPSLKRASLRAAFVRLFKRAGLPSTIRADNGTPFASAGPYGCSALSLWWMRLGIRVDFTRPAHPQDNGSHEQFHRVYKAENLHPPARSGRAQTRRHQQWLVHYNTQRPHEALGQRPPALFYRRSLRRYRPLKALFAYPRTWKVYRVGPKGTLRWHGRIRLLSRILAGERVGLRPTSPSTVDVYLDHLLVGNLHRDDPAGMRPVIVQRPKV